MIEYASDLVDLSRRLQSYMMLHAAELPEATRNHLLDAAGSPSPVDRIVNSAEALFAIKGDLDAAGREITAQLAQFAAVNGWHGLADRGLKIALAMNRLGGFKAPTGVTWPTAEDDPAPIDRFVAPDPDAAPPIVGVPLPSPGTGEA